MSMHAGYRWLYSRVSTGMDEGAKLRLDALLGLPGAADAYAAHRAESVAEAGFEVG